MKTTKPLIVSFPCVLSYGCFNSRSKILRRIRAKTPLSRRLVFFTFLHRGPQRTVIMRAHGFGPAISQEARLVKAREMAGQSTRDGWSKHVGWLVKACGIGPVTLTHRVGYFPRQPICMSFVESNHWSREFVQPKFLMLCSKLKR